VNIVAPPNNFVQNGRDSLKVCFFLLKDVLKFVKNDQQMVKLYFLKVPNIAAAP